MTDSQTQDKIENVETLEGDIKEDKSPKKDEEFEVKSEYYQIESDIPEHTHDGIVSPKINFSDLNGRPTLIERTATSIDLSGAAETLIVFHTEREATITNAYFLYTEATSADAGITIKIGKEEDDDYYYTGTSEVSKSQWDTDSITLLKRDIAQGDTVLFYSAGGKSGTGEIMLIIEYKFVESYKE
jgi:hypothetical protein